MVIIKDSYVEVTHTFVKPNRCFREQYSCNCSMLRVDVVIIKTSFVEVLYALPVSLYIQALTQGIILLVTANSYGLLLL